MYIHKYNPRLGLLELGRIKLLLAWQVIKWLLHEERGASSCNIAEVDGNFHSSWPAQVIKVSGSGACVFIQCEG